MGALDHGGLVGALEAFPAFDLLLGATATSADTVTEFAIGGTGVFDVFSQRGLAEAMGE